VVTNVFPYFESIELPLAVANLAAMLGPGGWLVHNELPIIGEAIFQAAGLPVEQGSNPGDCIRVGSASL
jgi:hypothetical protein